MRYVVYEHHFDFFAPAGKSKSTKVCIGHTNNKLSKASELADRRRACRRYKKFKMSATLSHWTVGDVEVAAQSALEMYNRQSEEQAIEAVEE